MAVFLNNYDPIIRVFAKLYANRFDLINPSIISVLASSLQFLMRVQFNMLSNRNKLRKLLQLVSVFFILAQPCLADKHLEAATTPFEAATFSLIVYDDWNNPSKPIPAGWAYYHRVRDNLMIDGYYGASFLKKEFNSHGKLANCEVFVAHRGTTVSILDYYEDFLILINKVPGYYNNARSFVDEVIEFAHNDCKNVGIDIIQTGHSLGGLLSELVVASGKYPDMFTHVFDTPGAKSIITGLVEDKQLSYRITVIPGEDIAYDFSQPNAINTCNEQWPSYNMIYAHEFLFEDFAQSNLATSSAVLGLPGSVYYFRYFTLNQHKMENFYLYWEKLWNSIEDKKRQHIYKSFRNSDWPIGFYAGLKNYYSYNSSYMNNYWKTAIAYIWNNNSGIRLIYKNDFNKFKDDYYKKLDAVTTASLNKNVEYDNSSLTYPLEISNKKPSLDKKYYDNLSNIIMHSYTGHKEQLARYYNASDIDRKLYLAVLANDIMLAKRLIIDGHANVNSQHGEKKYSLLQIAIILGHIDMMKLLLANNADPNSVNTDGETPMHTLGHERYTDIDEYAKYLIKAGARIGVKNISGITPEQIINMKCKGCLTSFK